MRTLRFYVLSLLLAAFSAFAPCIQEAKAAEGDEASWKETASDYWKEHFHAKGWVELVQSTRTHRPNDEVTSRVHGRLELDGYWDKLHGFISVDLEKNWTIPALDGFSFREAWLEYLSDHWDIRLGRQLIIWGKADGVRITDNICPTDYSDYLNRSIDEMRIPVTAAKLRFMSNTLTTEFIWIPEFKPAKLAVGCNPWALDYSSAYPFPVSSASVDKPSKYSIKDSEFAVKVSSYMAGVDVSLSAFYTWDDNAAMYYSLKKGSNGPEIELRPRHHRLMIYGLDFAVPKGDFVFRGEAAYFQGRRLSVQGGQPEKHNEIRGLLGIDWNAGKQWTVTAQLLDNWIVNYRRELTRKEHEPQATLNVSKKLFNEQLEIADMVYYSLRDKEYFNRLQVSYDFNDDVRLTIGWDTFHGDDGSYGIYRRNSQVWGKLRYTF